MTASKLKRYPAPAEIFNTGCAREYLGVGVRVPEWSGIMALFIFIGLGTSHAADKCILGGVLVGTVCLAYGQGGWVGYVYILNNQLGLYILHVYKNAHRYHTVHTANQNNANTNK